MSPGEILAITFTNKASREMAERAGELLGDRSPRDVGAHVPLRVRADHSAGARAPRRALELHDLRRRDTERLIAGISRDMNVDPRYPPKAVAAAIGKAKDQVLGPDEFAQMASNLYEDTVAGSTSSTSGGSVTPARSTSTT